MTLRNSPMSERSATGRLYRPLKSAALAWVLISPVAWPVHAELPLPVGSNSRYDTLQPMIACRVWLTSLQRCLKLTADVQHELVSDSEFPGHRVADHPGLRRDTYYFLGLQLAIVGALFFLPESVSGWSEEQKEQHHTDKWWNNVTDPTWDDDEHYINYVLHPYWGAAYYVRGRERGLGARGAFWYAFLLSTLYEAGVESLFEPVSVQDFLVTPIVGSWLGGYFMDWRMATRKRIGDTGRTRFRDRALLVATDPLGNTADFIDRRLGRLEFQTAPFVRKASVRAWAEGMPAAVDHQSTIYGISVKLRW